MKTEETPNNSSIETNDDSFRKSFPFFNSLKAFNSNPWVVFGLTIITLFSVIFAIYTWRESKADRQLIYYVNPARAVVVKAGQSSDIKVSYQDRKIEGDITAAQIAFWNAGKLPVKKTDILREVVIRTGNDSPILEASIRKEGRDVTHFAIDKTEMNNGRIKLDWNILEQNDGAVIQLIYVGDPSVDITAEGVVEGQRSVVQYRLVSGANDLDKIFSGNLSEIFSSSVIVIFIISMIIAISITGISFFIEKRNRNNTSIIMNFERFMFRMYFLALIIGFILIILYILLWPPPINPFKFE